jgi:radical SAM superfamily enzyme YgiQ (UPF0313 family)
MNHPNSSSMGNAVDTFPSVVPQKPLHCVFVHAPDPIYANTQNYGAMFMPVWAYTLAAHIPDDGRFTLGLCDTRFETLSSIPTLDVAIFSGINQDYASLVHQQEQLRQRLPDVITIIGGPICWSFDQAGDLEKLAMFDQVFIGDGEDAITKILEDILTGHALEPVVRNQTRFNMKLARGFDHKLLEGTIGRYYGAVLEVSRGCPFLCEFCDIRILPDNNRPHNKPSGLIVSEIDRLSRLGVRQVLLACDNFIGDPRWAEEVLDAIIAWQEKTGRRPSFYTWLTINLYRHPRLLEKLRKAGFDLLFIGIESFSKNSLLETAKVQNSSVDLVTAVQEIQSHGFIIVAGLIFGFDSDDKDCFDLTLEGLKESGLLSGDPSLLTALPGTPLYRRMKLAGRLRQVRYGLGGFKYQTNFKYLMPRKDLIGGYRYFISRYNRGRYQYQRLAVFMKFLSRSPNFVPLKGGGYGEMGQFLSMVLKNRNSALLLMSRGLRFCAHPGNLFYALLGLLLVTRSWHISGRYSYFRFWLFAWSNSILKYQNLSDDDFDLESVDKDFDLQQLMPTEYQESANEAIPANKTDAQIRTTSRQLRHLIDGTARSKPSAGTS